MHNIISFQTIDSTNAYLKENFRNLKEGDVCFSLHQTGGRGRLGRTWIDEGKDLLFSLLFLSSLDEKFAISLPLIAGAAMKTTLSKLGISSSIKWPNDVMIGDKKCCGILVEAVSQTSIDAIILGIGLNLNEESFVEELKDKATSLHIASGISYEQRKVLDVYLSSFDALLSDYRSGGKKYLQIIREDFYLTNKEVSCNYHGEGLFGTCEGIDDDGCLLLNDGKAIHRLHSGEVTLHNSYR